MAHSFIIDSQPLLLESQDGESQTTIPETVSQAERSNVGSTPDDNNNDTFGDSSFSTGKSSETDEEGEPNEVAKAGSVASDSHTPVKEEIDTRTKTPNPEGKYLDMSTPDREFCLQLEQTFEREQLQSPFCTKVKALKACIGSFIGITYKDGERQVGLLEEVDDFEPGVETPRVWLTQPMPGCRGPTYTPFILDIASFDIIPGERDMIERIITYMGYEFIVTTVDGEKHQGSCSGISKVQDHHYLDLYIPQGEKEPMIKRQIPLERIFKIEFTQRALYQKKISENADKTIIVQYQHEGKIEEIKGTLIGFSRANCLDMGFQIHNEQRMVSIHLSQIVELDFEDYNPHIVCFPEDYDISSATSSEKEPFRKTPTPKPPSSIYIFLKCHICILHFLQGAMCM